MISVFLMGVFLFAPFSTGLVCYEGDQYDRDAWTTNDLADLFGDMKECDDSGQKSNKWWCITVFGKRHDGFGKCKFKEE